MLQLAVKYNQYYIQALLSALTDKQPEVRQAAAYGIGVMAMYGQTAFAETLKRMLYIHWHVFTWI